MARPHVGGRHITQENGMHLVSLSYGGGIQSVAMGVLIVEGVLPRPDVVVIADTGREVQSTWDHVEDVMTPYLARVGLAVEIVPHSLARKDLYDASGLTLIPAYTRKEDGKDLWGNMLHTEGRKAAFCSGEWKRDVMERWLRLKGATTAEQWIGFSLDEKRRVKKDHRPWCKLRFPLIEKGITREMCKAIIRAAGLPLPHKSRCWMCSHQTDEEWAEVKASPDEFAKAVALEKEINEADPDRSADLFLYSGRVPLEMADFTKGTGPTMPAKPCEAANCWT